MLRPLVELLARAGVAPNAVTLVALPLAGVGLADFRRARRELVAEA